MIRSIWVITAEFGKDIFGGLGIVATHLAENLASEEVQVTVIALTSKIATAEWEHKGEKLQIYHVPRKSPYYVRGNMQSPIVREVYAHSQRPDMVHVHSLQGAWLARSISAGFRVPLVYTSHSMIRKLGQFVHRDQYSLKKQEELYRSAHTIIFPSALEKDTFLQSYAKYTHKAYVIPNGFKSERCEQMEKDVNQILYVGRLSPEKGIVYLIRALPYILEMNPKAYLSIVGSTGTEKYMKEIEAEINRLDLAKHIQIHPWKSSSDILQEYRKAKVVVVPSLYESFGLVPLEAVSQGTPVILTKNVGACAYLPPEMMTIAPSLHPIELGTAICAQMSKPMQKQAQSWLESFQWPQIAHQYLHLFQTIHKPIAPRLLQAK
jgi:glycogen synthase